MKISRAPIIPERVRRIAGQSFTFIPHRFLRDGFLASLSSDERSLYLFLVLAADRNGISFYHYDSICSLLLMTVEDYVAARNALIRKELLAFDGTRFQVLSLPPKTISAPNPPLRTDADLEDRDPATIRLIAQTDLAHSRESCDS